MSLNTVCDVKKGEFDGVDPACVFQLGFEWCELRQQLWRWIQTETREYVQLRLVLHNQNLFRLVRFCVKHQLRQLVHDHNTIGPEYSEVTVKR